MSNVCNGIATNIYTISKLARLRLPERPAVSTRVRDSYALGSK